MVMVMLRGHAAARLCVLVFLAACAGCAAAPAGGASGGADAPTAPGPRQQGRQVRFLLVNAEGYFFSGRYGEALPAYAAVLALDPGSAAAYRGRAATHAVLGHDAEALADYAQAIALAPRLDDAWLGRGLYLFSKGRYAEAIEDFDRAIAIDPNNAGAHLFKALACEKVGRLREAAAARESYIHCVIPREEAGPGESGVEAREVKALGLTP